MRNDEFADMMLLAGFILVLAMSGIFGSLQIEDQLLELFLCMARLLGTLMGILMVGKGLEGSRGKRKSIYRYMATCK